MSVPQYSSWMKIAWEKREESEKDVRCHIINVENMLLKSKIKCDWWWCDEFSTKGGLFERNVNLISNILISQNGRWFQTNPLKVFPTISELVDIQLPQFTLKRSFNFIDKKNHFVGFFPTIYSQTLTNCVKLYVFANNTRCTMLLRCCGMKYVNLNLHVWVILKWCFIQREVVFMRFYYSSSVNAFVLRYKKLWALREKFSLFFHLVYNLHCFKTTLTFIATKLANRNYFNQIRI